MAKLKKRNWVAIEFGPNNDSQLRNHYQNSDEIVEVRNTFIGIGNTGEQIKVKIEKG